MLGGLLEITVICTAVGVRNLQHYITTEPSKSIRG